MTWRREADHLTRTLEFDTFMKGIEFVNQVARVAEELDHHPDIVISFRRVTLNLSSHDAGGVTDRDFALSRKIDGVISEYGGRQIS